MNHLFIKLLDMCAICACMRGLRTHRNAHKLNTECIIAWTVNMNTKRNEKHMPFAELLLGMVLYWYYKTRVFFFVFNIV